MYYFILDIYIVFILYVRYPVDRLLRETDGDTEMNLNTQWQHRQLPASPQQQQHSTQQVHLDTSSINYLIIQAFHSLPHLNMWFELSNSTFDPNSSDYLEVCFHSLSIIDWSNLFIKYNHISISLDRYWWAHFKYVSTISTLSLYHEIIDFKAEQYLKML